MVWEIHALGRWGQNAEWGATHVVLNLVPMGKLVHTPKDGVPRRHVNGGADPCSRDDDDDDGESFGLRLILPRV